MKTYRKRIAAFALAALMGLACISCGKTDESSQPTASQTETTAEVTTAVTTTATKTETTTTTAETTTETTTPQTTTSVTTTTATTTTAKQAVTAPPQATAAPVVQTAAKTPQKTVSGSLDSIVKSYPRNTSVILYCMDGKTLYSNAPNRVYYGASMIKLPYVYYCCTQLEKGIHSLDETVTYTDANYFPGSGVIINRGSGKKYTVEQLIDYTLRYSDNVAYIMLIHLFGIDGFNKMTKEWGYGNIQLYSYSYFADVTPNFILTSMKKMQAKSANSSRIWQAAWKALLGSDGLYIKQRFANEAVAGKYGYKSGVYHEACYFGGKEPYILVVMSEINGIEQCGSYLASVASAARAEVNKYTAQKEAAKTTTTTTTTTATMSQTSPTEETTTETTPETTTPETTEPTTTPPETTQEIFETSETVETTPYDEN